MSNIVRWDPFSDLRVNMDRLFEDGFSRPRRRVVSAREFAATVPVEVSETADGFEVKASLPGVRPEDVDISVDENILTIKGEYREEKKAEAPAVEGETPAEAPKRQFYRRELRYGNFQRSLSLPSGIDSDKAAAKFENGILHLTLPKAEANRPKQIKVAGVTTES